MRRQGRKGEKVVVWLGVIQRRTRCDKTSFLLIDGNYSRQAIVVKQEERRLPGERRDTDIEKGGFSPRIMVVKGQQIPSLFHIIQFSYVAYQPVLWVRGRTDGMQ